MKEMICFVFQYQFVTKLTSMVVTLPDKTKANPSEVDARDQVMADSLPRSMNYTYMSFVNL
jgi:hypothetical protein